jgi:hypothetical protein
MASDSKLAYGNPSRITIHYCPFCGEKLGDWVTDGSKCRIVKEEPELIEPDYDPTDDEPDTDFSEGDSDES